MDGNARWAASGNLSKAEGHKKEQKLQRANPAEFRA